MGNGFVPHGLCRGWTAGPKLIVAAANAGQYGVGDSDDPDQPEYLPWPLERAKLSHDLSTYGQQVNWWELEDLDVTAVRMPLLLLNIYELFRLYGQDLDNIKTEEQADMIAAIEKLRSLLKEGGTGS